MRLKFEYKLARAYTTPTPSNALPRARCRVIYQGLDSAD
jgi:hypothetical protein